VGEKRFMCNYLVEEARIDAWFVLLPLAVLQYNNLLNKLPRQKIYGIIGDAVGIEFEFVSDFKWSSLE
jgi:hypothetical protein